MNDLPTTISQTLTPLLVVGGVLLVLGLVIMAIGIGLAIHLKKKSK